MAVVATRTILDLQADAPPGSVAAELEQGANFHLVVHQAAGMVSVQLGIGVTEALVRLRGTPSSPAASLDEVSGTSSTGDCVWTSPRSSGVASRAGACGREVPDGGDAPTGLGWPWPHPHLDPPCVAGEQPPSGEAER